MPPTTPATLSAPAVVVQSPSTSEYSAERLAIIKLMAVMTALAVALLMVVSTWFTSLEAVQTAPGDVWSGVNLRLVGGSIGVLVLVAAMLTVWVRLVKRLARIDWED